MDSGVGPAISRLDQKAHEIMTERDWINGSNPALMLDHLCRHCKASHRKNGRRKLRLFACACCRQFWDLVTDERSRRAIEISERYADGQESEEALAEAHLAAEMVSSALGKLFFSTRASATKAAWIAANSVSIVTGVFPAKVLVGLVLNRTSLATRAASGEDQLASLSGGAASQALYRRQCDLARCIFGNPFRPLKPLAPVLLRWNDGLLRRLGEAAYDVRSVDGILESTRLAVLADALEEAGCDVPALLGHLRGPGPHYRGCHVVDLILSKDR
jgi:hypothetical protein